MIGEAHSGPKGAIIDRTCPSWGNAVPVLIFRSDGLWPADEGKT